MAASRLADRSNMCLLCLNRSLRGDWLSQRLSGFGQIRGKRKMAKKELINVRLLKDIEGYGAKGSIVPVARGLFRNTWLPHRRAEYLSTIHGVNGRKAEAVRDPLFGKEQGITAQEQPDQLGPMSPTIPQISPERATELLDKYLPPDLEIRAPVIPTGRPAASQAATDDSIADITEPQDKRLFGSITADDIAILVRSKFAKTEANVLNLRAANFKILRPGDKELTVIDKVKELGRYSVQIQVTGGEVLTRTIDVTPPNDDQLQIHRVIG